MTERVNGVVATSAPTASCRPGGDEAKVRSTVRGCTSSEAVAVLPSASVAVTRSSMYEGYSWSGAGNEPEAVLSNVW